MKRAILILTLASITSAYAQYGVTWPTPPTSTPMASNVQPGTQSLRVSGINDFLYTYDINVVEVSTAPSISAFPPTGALAGCTDPATITLTGDAQNALDGYKKLFPASASPAKTLSSTQSEWATFVQASFDKLPADFVNAQAGITAITDAQMKALCQGSFELAKHASDDLTAAKDKLFKGPHVAVATFIAKACKSEILTVIEKYNGVPTGQMITVQLDAECNQFTASGGVLFSEIQNRTYTSGPSAAGSGNFLSVSGTGRFSPTLTSLFNFNLPVAPVGNAVSSSLGDVRFGISTGPVLQLSSSQASSFGWFVGGSISFLKYLYITPGEHFGQFADFPPGFKEGQQVPANFGTLTPTKRWTGRFGFAVTIKGWDVSKAVKGGTDQPATTKKQ